MRFKLFITVLISALAAVACSNKSNNNSEEQMTQSPKSIVCYFSASGVTKAQAQRIANIINADLHEIVPQAPYTDADLDWRDRNSRSTIEMNDSTSRPAIGNSIDLSGYDIVFIGYPNWWNTAPRIINTFIESNDLKGKTIVPFMTSGGSDITNSEHQLAKAYPNMVFAPGLLMNNVSDEEISEWSSTILNNK